MNDMINDKTKVSKKEMSKGVSGEFELFVGTFDNNKFTWYLISKHKTVDKAYKAFKDFVAKQFRLSDEDLKKKWDTGRLDIELRKGSKLLQWVGIYSSEVKELDEKNIKKDSETIFTYKDFKDPEKFTAVMKEFLESGKADQVKYSEVREMTGIKRLPEKVDDFINLVISNPRKFSRFFERVADDVYGKDNFFMHWGDEYILNEMIPYAAQDFGSAGGVLYDSDEMYSFSSDEDMEELLEILSEDYKYGIVFDNIELEVKYKDSDGNTTYDTVELEDFEFTDFEKDDLKDAIYEYLTSKFKDEVSINKIDLKDLDKYIQSEFESEATDEVYTMEAVEDYLG